MAEGRGLSHPGQSALASTALPLSAGEGVFERLHRPVPSSCEILAGVFGRKMGLQMGLQIELQIELQIGLYIADFGADELIGNVAAVAATASTAQIAAVARDVHRDPGRAQGDHIRFRTQNRIVAE